MAQQPSADQPDQPSHPLGAAVEVTGGVDTHRDTHTAAALDGQGRLLGHRQFPATAAGYAALLGWLRASGRLVLVGVEGTGSYGAELTAHLQQAGIAVVEVDRPDRAARRRDGKSDPLDAESAARAALAGRADGLPKQRGGPVQALAALRVARRSAVDQRADVTRQIKSLIVTAPEALRAQLRPLTDTQLIRHCATRRPDPTQAGDPQTATVLALRSLARRHQQLTDEINQLDKLITPLVRRINPTLIAIFGVGPDTAGQLLVTAGTTPSGCGRRPRSRCSAAPRHSRPRPGAPTATGSTAAATDRPTPRSTAS